MLDKNRVGGVVECQTVVTSATRDRDTRPLRPRRELLEDLVTLTIGREVDGAIFHGLPVHSQRDDRLRDPVGEILDAGKKLLTPVVLRVGPRRDSRHRQVAGIWLSNWHHAD